MDRKVIVPQGDTMSFRTEAIAAIESGIVALGLHPVVSAYLRSTFGATGLAELDDSQLTHALRFVSELQKAGGVRSSAPLPAGITDGEYLWFRGRFDWRGGS